MIRSLKYTLLFVATLLFVGCSHDGNSFTIEGEFDGMKSGELFIYSPSRPNSSIDTLRITDSHFEYSREIYDTIPYVILFPNAVEQVVFVSPGATIEYHAATNDLKNYKVEGSEENDLMTAFRKEASEVNEKDVKEVARRYITDNPQSVVSLYLFDRYFLQSDNSDFTTIRDMLSRLRSHHPTNLLLFSVENMIKNAGSLYEGKKLYDIELTDLKKEKRKLWSSTSQKDYTLLLFWASWQRNSYDLLFRIRNLQKTYSEQIRFAAISLDNQRYRWEDLVRRDSLIIDHYCDGLSWSSPVVNKLSLESLPILLLLDKNHKILFSTDDIQKMTDKLKKQIH